jgi:tellurite resistance protein TehA-like permease
MDDHHAAGLALLLVGSLAWLVLGYVVPWVAASGRGRRPTLQDADGTWFMWVVAGQSVAVLAATLAPEITEGRRELALLAVVAWAVGVFLYAAAGIFVAARLLRYPVRPDEVTPPYWIAMGATAITVVAGADIVRMSVSPIATAVRNVVEGGSVLFWAFGTWLIPPLIAVGVWRHVRHRIPLRYEPALWSIVFPIGMYGVGSHTLGLAAHLSVITEIGIHEAWVAAGVWLVTFVAMGCHLLRPARHVSPDDRLTAGAAPRSEMRPSGEH